MKRIILASASPRRKEILEQTGIAFEICPSTKEECITKQIPSEIVEELSYRKASDVTERFSLTEEDFAIIGADTLVFHENQIFGKPKDEEDAIRMLSLLQGHTHQVYTGVTLSVQKKRKRKTITFHEKTDVVMYPMAQKQIADYVATKEPMDKAGAYAIQGKCALYIKEIHGDYNTVVGFPIARIMQELSRAEKEMEETE